METDEISKRYIAPCFVNGLEAYDGEVNLVFDKNLIPNEFTVKLCLDYEMKKGKKLVKKELIVALNGELYFVKVIINHEEDDFEPGDILRRSFLRLAHGVVDFGNGVITIYHEPDPFEDDSEKIGKSSDDWNQLLDFNFDDTPGTHDEEARSSRSKHPRQHETVKEKLMMLRIRVCKAESDEEIFTSVAWIRAFNINELIYAKLCHEFYSIYEFDEVCANDELQSKKIIKFRLGGRAHSLTLLEFARRLGLYQAVELEEDGYKVYFEGGLRNDDNFNSQDYWLSISQEDNLGLSRSHTSTIKNLILRVIHKMITYGLCQRMISLSNYEMDEEERSWDSKKESNLLWDLDSTTLRDLIDSEGKLIPEDPQPGVPRVGIPRPPRASM
nr:hypothetical protein [Tanacetum cinerariifolium]